MFNVFKSNKVETLMEVLIRLCSAVPDNPLSPEWIGVQSKGMKQWICTQVAEKTGICANFKFMFPRQMVDHILFQKDPLAEQTDLLNPDLLFWSVLKWLHSNKTGSEKNGIESYIRADATETRVYQLALRLAKILDDYQVYRPDMLLDFQNRTGSKILKDPTAKWQAALWQDLISPDPENHLAIKAHGFLNNSLSASGLSHLPPRMSLFGISAIPDLFLKVFEKASHRIDVNLFLLTPSQQFFSDIQSPRQMGKAALKQTADIDLETLYYEMTNPLLSSLGTAGKAFFSSVEAFDYHEPGGDLFSDPIETSPTVLNTLQSDILNLVHRKKGGTAEPVALEPSDTSVTIHACHSPIREAQVVKDLLMTAFESDPQLEPHEIIVMMPDIEAYAPYIESVFSLETPLPFSISDRHKRSESEPLEAFLKIIDLKNSRLELACVMDLLLCPSIAGKFFITPDDIGMIEKMARDSHILWGMDAGHRKHLGLPGFEENTWQFGLQRLFMGMAMPENYDTPVQGILPCQPFEGLDLEVLGKFSAFCHALFSSLETLSGQKNISLWCDTLHRVLQTMLVHNFENSEDIAFVRETLDQVKKDAGHVQFSSSVSFDTMHPVIVHKLDQTVSQGNFIAGNITFCNIMPMRSIPFKIVVLMGMDEKSFPRQSFEPGFSLMKKYPRPGDSSQRADDRYLFLETLLSSRSRFVVTYTGINIQDNSLIPASGVVCELMETLDQGFIFSNTDGCRVFHPLHPFHPIYFDQTGPVVSFSKANCRIAASIVRDRAEPFVFFLPGSNISVSDPQTSLDEIIRFFRNPVEAYMKQSLNIAFKTLEEPPRERESFTLDGLEQYALGSFLVEKQTAGSADSDLYAVLRAMGSLPLGEKGRFEYNTLVNAAMPVIKSVADALKKPGLPPLPVETTVMDMRISGCLSNIREDGAYLAGYGKINSVRLLAGWIRHLFLNLCALPGYPGKTHLIGRDTKGKNSVCTCSFPAMEPAVALRHLSRLIEIYEQGMKRPVYFFCETAWLFAQALSKAGWAVNRENVLSAMVRARAAWYGGYLQKGEKENRYVLLLTENKDPFESVEALMATDFIQNALRVYQPLMASLETAS